MAATSRLQYILLLCILLLAIGLRVSTLNNHVVPSGDEGSFLTIARNLTEGKGFTNNVVTHYYNKNESLPYYEDTRHPLYPAFLALGFKIFGYKMAVAQWLNLIMSIGAIVIVFILARQIHSVEVALLSAFCMSISWPLIKYSVYVYAETFFQLVFLLLILFLIKLNEKRYSDFFTGSIIGVLIGLLYLIRPNGIFLLFAALIFFWFENKRALRWIAASFLVVGGWWMIRNILIFGNPLYGHFNYFMWIDKNAELWGMIQDSPPSAITFLKTHSVPDMFMKFIMGTKGFLSELWKFEGISYPLNKVIYPFVFYYLFVYKGVKRYWRFVLVYFLITLLPIIWTASVIWIARYLLPYYPILFIMASISLVEIAERVGKKATIISLFLAICIGFQFYPLKFLISPRNGDHSVKESYTDELQWLESEAKSDIAILTGDLVQQQFYSGLKMIKYPRNESLQKALAFSVNIGATHFLVNREMVKNISTLKEFWSISNNKITCIKNSNDLKLIQRGTDFCIYKIKMEN